MGSKPKRKITNEGSFSGWGADFVVIVLRGKSRGKCWELLRFLALPKEQIQQQSSAEMGGEKSVCSLPGRFQQDV